MSSRTARIARNTLMLYFRQILTLLVGLYTVRVVLNALGAEDYGIFKVVESFVVIFVFLNTAMVSATQRFLNFALGQNDSEQARNVYSVSFLIHALIAILFIIITETIGLWFFYTWLNIPADRQNVAFIVYQFSVATTVLSILRVPYNATIIAYEKMSFYAWISIIEVTVKLLMVFLLTVIIYDKLIFYALFLFITGIIILLIYKIYCNRTFVIAHFRFCRDKNLYRQLAEFSGWNVLGQFSSVSSHNGLNILLNIFFGVTVNAAMGIAMQVKTITYSFIDHFQTAFRPQIIKSYASQDYRFFLNLVFQSSKASFFLLLFIVLPFYINADFILGIWLGNVPEFTVIFTRLFLLFALLETLAAPLWMSIMATGDIKKYQIIESSFNFLSIPVSFCFLLLGFGPFWVLIIKIVNFVLLHVWRIFFVGKKLNFSVKKYLFEVIIPISVIVVISGSVSLFSNIFFTNWAKLLLTCTISTLCTGILIYFIGLNAPEKASLHNFIKIKWNNKYA